MQKLKVFIVVRRHRRINEMSFAGLETDNTFNDVFIKKNDYFNFNRTSYRQMKGEVVGTLNQPYANLLVA